jgi:hypothetical protein
MRTVYLICLRAQYTLWALYLFSFLILYVLGFFVDTLGLRWILIPETIGMLLASIALSLVIVAIFVVQRGSRKDIQGADRFRLRGALPSMVLIAATIVYIVESLLER